MDSSMAMKRHLRPKLERLSTSELWALQNDACAHLVTLDENDPVRDKGEGVLDAVVDELAKRLDDQLVVDELRRLYAL